MAGKPDRLFNDFLYALKVGDELENPLRRTITDKALAKDYILSRLGAGRTVPTLAVLETPKAIAAFRPDAYPVAVKPTHSSGKMIRIGSDADWQAAEPVIAAWLTHDFFTRSLERNYAGLAKRVIVEPWLDESLLFEGSVHCRAGVPKVVSMIERYSKKRQSFSTDRTPLGVSLGFPTTDFHLDEWIFFEPLLKDAAILSAELSYIRLDFYTDGRRVVFGEMTNLPAAGLGQFHPAGGEEIFSAVFFAPPP
ncbi:MAG: ATP-grasp fold amidoligase family protein [Rhodobacterales bacterium]|nr:ATP-grasp fold amidoligase family protein [Rhodobacterales bacterium]